MTKLPGPQAAQAAELGNPTTAYFAKESREVRLDSRMAAVSDRPDGEPRVEGGTTTIAASRVPAERRGFTRRARSRPVAGDLRETRLPASWPVATISNRRAATRRAMQDLG
ncbi:MAG: hypothetical protein U0805_03045 [Pirellulales bacterium]